MSLGLLDESTLNAREEGSSDAEEEEHASASLLRVITDAAGDVIYAKDRNGRFTFANEATLALIGKPRDQILGRTDAEVLEDRDAARQVMENDRVVMDSGVGADLEELVPLPDGTRRLWLSRKMPHRDSSGEVVGLIGVSRDITDQRRASDLNARLYAVAAALSDAQLPHDVARVTVEHGISSSQATAGSLYLLDDDGAQLEMTAMIGYPPEAVATWQRIAIDAPIPIAEALRTGAPIYLASSAERLARYPALEALSAASGTSSTASIPLTIGGRAVGVLGLSFDREGSTSSPDERAFMLSLARQCAQALERARLFEAEKVARADAELASTMKDDFLATLSHELRTPLNAILGWAAVLLPQATTPSHRRGLETILRNARAQARIVSDLLDMSAILSGRLRLEARPLLVSQTLESAIDTVRIASSSKGVGLVVEIEPDVGFVRGDADRLQQVFLNLLANAVKFTPEGGAILVGAARRGAQTEITIADNGIGIPPGFLPHVFERFRQADASITRTHGGLGLGLALVKQLVELHGGTVHAASEGVGSGSTFTVSLPSLPEDGSPP